MSVIKEDAERVESFLKTNWENLSQLCKAVSCGGIVTPNIEERYRQLQEQEQKEMQDKLLTMKGEGAIYGKVAGEEIWHELGEITFSDDDKDPTVEHIEKQVKDVKARLKHCKPFEKNKLNVELTHLYQKLKKVKKINKM